MLLPSWLLAEAAQASPELVGDVRRALPSAAAATAPKTPSWQSIVLNPALLESRGSSVQVREAHAGTNGKLIIHIQDAHSNPGAQKHLAEALDDWMSRYPMRLVLSEGGEGNTTLDAVRRTADAATWKRAAEQMLRDAIITGEEYLNLTSERPMTIWGVENEKLYERNLGVYAELMDDRGNRKKFLSRTRAAIDALKSREYPSFLLQYERRKAADAESGTSSVKALLGLARTAGVAWSGRYPNLESFGRVMERENGIDFAQLNRETQELASRLSAAERDELQSALKQRASQDSESRAADAQVLMKKSQSHGGAAAYPQIHRYAEFVSQIQMIDWGAVMHDSESLEEDVYAAALRSDEEKRLHALDAWTGLLEKAFSIRLSTREYQRLNRLRTAFPADGWQAWLNRELADAKLFDRMIAADRRLDEGFERVMRFYELVERRDQEFIQNTLAALADQKADAAFLITGGYHTDHLTELLKENGFSYVVAAPWVDSETDQALYEKVLLRKTESNAGADKTTDVTQDSAGSFLRTHLATPAILAARLADLSASRPVYRDVLPGVQKILAARLADTQSAVRSNYDLLVRQFAAAFADASEINEDGNDGPARLLYFDIDPATGLIRHLMDEFPDDGDYPHFTLEAVEAFRIEQGATDLVHYAILPHYRANGQSVKTRWFPIGGIPAAQAERIENVLEQSFAAFNDRPYVATVPSASSAGARLAKKSTSSEEQPETPEIGTGYLRFRTKPYRDSLSEAQAISQLQRDIAALADQLEAIHAAAQQTPELAQKKQKLLRELDGVIARTPYAVAEDKTPEDLRQVRELIREKLKSLNARIRTALKDKDDKALARSNAEAIRLHAQMLSLQAVNVRTLLTDESLYATVSPQFARPARQNAALAVLDNAVSHAAILKLKIIRRDVSRAPKTKMAEYIALDARGNPVRVPRPEGFDITFHDEDAGDEAVTWRQRRARNVNSTLQTALANLQEGQPGEAARLLGILHGYYSVPRRASRTADDFAAIDAKIMEMSRIVAGYRPENQAPVNRFEALVRETALLIRHPKIMVMESVRFRNRAAALRSQIRHVPASLRASAADAEEYRATLEYFAEDVLLKAHRRAKAASVRDSAARGTRAKPISEENRDTLVEALSEVLAWIRAGYVDPKLDAESPVREALGILQSSARTALSVKQYWAARGLVLRAASQIGRRRWDAQRISGHVYQRGLSLYAEKRDYDVAIALGQALIAASRETLVHGEIKESLEGLRNVWKQYFAGRSDEPILGYRRARTRLEMTGKKLGEVEQRLSRGQKPLMNVVRAICGQLIELQGDIDHRDALKVAVQVWQGSGRAARREIFYFQRGVTAPTITKRLTAVFGDLTEGDWRYKSKYVTAAEASSAIQQSFADGAPEANISFRPRKGSGARLAQGAESTAEMRRIYGRLSSMLRQKVLDIQNGDRTSPVLDGSRIEAMRRNFRVFQSGPRKNLPVSNRYGAVPGPAVVYPVYITYEDNPRLVRALDAAVGEIVKEVFGAPEDKASYFRSRPKDFHTTLYTAQDLRPSHPDLKTEPPLTPDEISRIQTEIARVLADIPAYRLTFMGLRYSVEDGALTAVFEDEGQTAAIKQRLMDADMPRRASSMRNAKAVIHISLLRTLRQITPDELVRIFEKIETFNRRYTGENRIIHTVEALHGAEERQWMHTRVSRPVEFALLGARLAAGDPVDREWVDRLLDAINVLAFGDEEEGFGEEWKEGSAGEVTEDEMIQRIQPLIDLAEGMTPYDKALWVDEFLPQLVQYLSEMDPDTSYGKIAGGLVGKFNHLWAAPRTYTVKLHDWDGEKFSIYRLSRESRQVQFNGKPTYLVFTDGSQIDPEDGDNYLFGNGKNAETVLDVADRTLLVNEKVTEKKIAVKHQELLARPSLIVRDWTDLPFEKFRRIYYVDLFADTFAKIQYSDRYNDFARDRYFDPEQGWTDGPLDQEFVLAAIQHQLKPDSMLSRLAVEIARAYPPSPEQPETASDMLRMYYNALAYLYGRAVGTTSGSTYRGMLEWFYSPMKGADVVRAPQDASIPMMSNCLANILASRSMGVIRDADWTPQHVLKLFQDPNYDQNFAGQLRRILQDSANNHARLKSAAEWVLRTQFALDPSELPVDPERGAMKDLLDHLESSDYRAAVLREGSMPAEIVKTPPVSDSVVELLSRLKDAGSWKAESGKELDLLRAVLKSFGRVPVMYLPTRDNSQYHGQLILDGLSSVSGWLNDTQIGIIKQHFLTRSKQAARLASVRHEALRLEGGSIDAVQVERRVAELFSPVASALEPDQKLYATVEVGTRFERDALADLGFAVKSGTDEEVAADIADMIEKSGIESVSLTGFDLSVKLKGMSEADLPDITLHRKFNQQFSANIRSAVEPRALADRVKMSAVVSSLITGLRTGDVLVSAETLDAWFSVPRVMEFPSDPAQREALSVALGVLDVNLAPSQIAGAEDWRSFLAESAPKPAPNSITETATAAASERKELIVKIAQAMDEWLGSWPAREFGKREDLANGLAHYLRVLTRPIQESDLGTAVKILQKISLERLAQDPALYKRIRTQQMDSLAVFKQVFMVRRREFQERVRSWQDNGGVSDEKLLSLTHDLYLYLVKMRRLLMVCELMTADSMVRPSDREAYDYLLADLMFTEDAYLKISRELVSSRIMAQDTIDRERLTVSYLEDPDTDTAQADAASLQPMVVELRGLLEQDIADLNDGFTAKTLGRRYGEVLKLAGDLERELTGRPELTDEAKYLIGAIFQSMIVIRRNHMNYSWSPSEGFRGTMGEKSGVQADDPYVLLFERLLPAAGIHGADVRALFEADGARLAMDRSSDESVITEVVANFVERYSKLPKATTDPVLLTRIRKKLIRMMMSQPYTSWEPDGAEESLLPIEETLVRFPEMREPRQLLRLIGWSMTSRDEMEADAFILPDVEKLLMRPNFSIQDLDTVVAPAMGIARRSRVFGLSGIVKAYEAGLSSEQVKDLMAPFLATRSTQVGHLMDFAGRLVSWHHLSPEEVQDLLLPVLQKNIMFAGVDSHLLTEVFTNKKIGKKNFVRFMKPFAALGLSAWDADNAIDAVLLQSLRSKTWTAREIVRHLYPLIGAGKEDAWFFISKVTAGVKSGKIRKTDVVPHFLPLIWAFGSTPEKVFLYAYDQLRLKGFPKPKPLENDAITDAINENKRGPFYKQSLYRDFAARHANEEVSVETVRLELALPIIEAAIRHIDWARQHKKPVVNLYGEQGERYYQWLLETKKLLGSDMLEQINRMFDTNSSESVRVAAIRTLGGTQFDAARRALETELLSSGDSVNDLIRMEVLEALARIGSAESLPTVKVVVSSPDFSAPLRVKAREVHDRISAQSTSAARLANFDWNDMLLALYVEYGTETFTSKDLAEKDVRGASTLLSYQRTGWIEQVDPTSRTFRLTESGRSLAEARMQHYGSDVTKYPYLFQIQRPNIPRKPDQGEILKRLQSIRARQARFQEIQPTSAELAGIIGIEESELAAFIEKLNAPPAPEPGDRSDRLVLAIAADLNPDRFTMSELTRGGVKDAGDALSGAGWRAPGGALIEELDGGVKVLDPVTNRMTRAYRLTEKGKAYVRQRQSQFQSIIDQPFLFESVKFDPKREVKKLGTAAWDSIRRRFRRLPEEKRGEAQKVLAKRLGMSANELWLKLAEPMSASMPNEKLLKAKLKEVLNGLRGLKRTAVHDARAFDKPIEAIVHMADKRQSSKLVGFYAEGLRQVRADFVTLNEHYHHLNTTVFFGDQWSKTLKLIEEAEAIVQAAQDQVSDKGGSSPASAARLAATQEWAEANGLQILAGGHEGEVASGDGDLLDVVDENGAVREELSPMTQADVHIKGEWHKTVHIHVFAPDGRLLLQRRSLRKSSSPGKLQVAVSGHVNAGEGDLQAAIREAEEELGLVLRPEDLIDVTGGKRLVRDYQLATGRNRELTTAYAVRLTQDQLDRIVSNYNLLEVQDVWLVPMDRLQQLVHEAPEAFSNSLRQLVEPEQGGILTRLFESGNKTEKLPQKDLLTVSDETFLETKLRFEKLAPGQHVEDVVSSLREEADPALWKFVTLGQLEYSVRLSKMTLDELRGEWEVLDVGRPGMDGLPGDIAANPIQNFSHHLRNDRFYLIYPDGLSSQVLERAAMRHALKREIYYRWDRVPKNRSHLLFRPDVTRRPASDTGARLAANVEPQEILSDTDQDMEARNRKIVDQFNSLRGVLKGVDMGSGLEGNFVDDVESGAWLPRARFVGYELPPVVPASLDKVGDRVVLRSAADTGLDDASVDVVTINMPSPPTIPDLLPGFLQEADRILKPGGKVYLTVQQPRADDLVYPSIQDLALSHRPGKLNFVPQVREILKTTRLNVEVDGASVETLGFDYPETTYMNLLKRSGWDVVMFTAEKPAVTPASLQTAAVDGARLAENAFDSLKPVTLKGLEEADREAAVRQLAEAARQGVSGTVAYRVTQAEYVMTEIQVAKSVTVGDGSWSATLPRAAQEVRPAPGTDSGAGDSVVEIAQQIRQEEADFVEAAVRKTAATQQPVVIQLAIRIGGWMDQTRDPQNSKKAYLRYQLAKLRELKKRDPNLYFEWNEKLTDADTIALLNTVAPDLVAPKAPVNTPVISVVDVLGGEKPSGDTRSFYEQGMAKEGVLPRLLESVVLASDLARLADPEHISQEQLDRWSSLAQTPVSREAAIRILTGQATPDEMLKYAIRARGLSLNINQLLTLFQVGARMSAIAA